VFFHFVLQGLRGKAKNDDGEVTWSRLSEYVRERVTKEIGTIVGGNARQTPHEMGNVRGSSPVLVRGLKADAEVAKDKDGPAKTEVAKDSPLDKDGKNSIGMDFKHIPKPKGDKFLMGSPQKDKDRGDDEKQHDATIDKAFYLGKYEVTQKQFKKVMGY